MNIINARSLSTSLFATIALTASGTAAVSRITLGAVGLSTGPITEPAVVDFGALSGDTTYEFSFNAAKGGPSTAIAGNLSFAVKLDQWNETGIMGTTEFGVADNQFAAIAGQSVNSIFGADVHLALVSDATAAEVRLYVDGSQVGTLAGELPLSDMVAVMGARDGTTDPMGAGSVMHGWASYDSALNAGDIAELSNTPFAPIPEPSSPGLLILGSLLMVTHRKRARK